MRGKLLSVDGVGNRQRAPDQRLRHDLVALVGTKRAEAEQGPGTRVSLNVGRVCQCALEPLSTFPQMATELPEERERSGQPEDSFGISGARQEVECCP